MPRRMILLTDGFTDPSHAKTASCLIRYCREEVLALMDRALAGRTAEAVLDVGDSLPVVGSLDAVEGANMLVLGTAPVGGKLPAAWRPIILDAIDRGMDVVSGLHDFLADDAEVAEAAQRRGVRLVDVRRNDEHDVATHQGIREECLRIHTVANTSSCGKMVASLEVARGLIRAGVDAKFVATGQTGIMVEGDGCPIDRVIADFVAGAAENLVRANQRHEVIVVEGQGSLVHPLYSGVTLGLLHGVRPDGLILCYQMGRDRFDGLDDVVMPQLCQVRDFFETAANFLHPCRVIGIAVNGRGHGDDEVDAERDRARREFGLPACDVLRHGPDDLVEAVLARKREVGK
ncbi:MAG: DUF1611 domain-containing protein [Pirellulales bacterium]|nr:DUF1611 domain-containing protein [Pirellulales bacterium]